MTDYSMLQYRVNETLGLRFQGSQFDESLIRILEAKNALTPIVLLKPKSTQSFVVAISWLIFFIGSYFRLILYKYLYEKRKKNDLTVIDKLTFALTIFQQLDNMVSSLATSLLVYNGDSLMHVYGGTLFCYFQKRLFAWSLYYSVIGSLGVSVYRILLIKKNLWVKNVIGEKVIFRTIMYGGILLSLIFVVNLTSTDYQKLQDDTCMLVKKQLIFEILDEYEQSQGKASPLAYWVVSRRISGAIMVTMIISELIIYVMFFHHMYTHDNSTNLRRVLEPRIIKERNKRNAITFFGQFCSFAFELMTMLLFILGSTLENKDNIIHDIGIGMWRTSFAVMSLVEVLTSPVLRKKVFKLYLYDIIFGLF